jgi:hypothetical protein
MAKKRALKTKKTFLDFKIPLNVLFALILALAGLIMLKKQSGKVLGLKTVVLNSSYTSEWEEIVGKNPDYRDGWLQLCVSYLEQGNKVKAREALQMAKTLDPNNEKVVLLERLLEE